MSEKQLQAATQSMADWLAHPQELGKRPSKIEWMSEFDLHGLHYYVFRYKKSLLEKWLLGVCGGYEGQALEHCGHVFSEMEEYDPSTADEKSVAMVEMIREHWMQEAAEEREGGSFISFVLLDACEWDRERFLADLESEWGVVPEGAGDEAGAEDGDTDPDSQILVFEWRSMRATVGLMPLPVPAGEAEHNAATNYLWPEAVEETQKHVAHLMIAVLPRETQDPLETGKLLVKLCDTCLKDACAIGVYTAGTVFQPSFYRDAAAVMKGGELPYLNWLYFGLRQSVQGSMNGYTFGLKCFGKHEIEVIDTEASPGELRDFLFQVAAYVLSSGVILRDGETIGFTADQKLPITRSEGFNLDGMTLKIGFRPVAKP